MLSFLIASKEAGESIRLVVWSETLADGGAAKK